MPTLKQDSQGQYFLDTGGGVLHPISEQQAQALYDNPGGGNNLGASVAQGTENLVTGAASLLSGNPYWQQANQQGRDVSEALNLQGGLPAKLGQFAPQAGAGLATAGAGLAPTIGLEAALGAATTPEAPIQGALIGGATAGAAEMLPGAVSALYGAGRRQAQRLPWFKPADAFSEIPPNPGGMMPGERAPVPGSGPAAADAGVVPPATAGAGPGAGPITPSPSANPPGMAPNPAAPRMADRVMNTVDQQTPGQQVAGTRVMEGTLTPDELYARGVPTTEGQRALLTATSPDAGATARTLLQREEATSSHPTFGQGIRNVKDAQQQAATNLLTRELEIPHGINLTDPMLSDVVANIGGRLDQIAGDMGTVPMTAQIKNEFADILGQTTGSHKAQLQQLVDEIGAKSDLNSGVLTGDQWQEMRTKINKMIEAGMRQGNIGKVSDAGSLMDTMTDAMEAGLPEATRGELDKLRRQYAIAMTLQKPGARNADGQVNPLSFYNNWKRPQSAKKRGTDDIGRFMNTIVTLTQKRIPDSGTAGRLLQNAASIGADLIPGGNMIRRATGI